MVTSGQHQFFLDFVGIVGVAGKDQQHHPRLAQSPHDCFLKILAGANIPAGDPAILPARFQSLANRFRDLAILGRVADENRRTQGTELPCEAEMVVDKLNLRG